MSKTDTTPLSEDVNFGVLQFIPENEWNTYISIQRSSAVYSRKFLKAWNKHKPKLAAAIFSNIKKQIVRKSQHDDVLDSFFNDIDKIAKEGFTTGVDLGDTYFTNLYGVKGLSQKQKQALIKDYDTTFKDKTRRLYGERLDQYIDSKDPVEETNVLDLLGAFDGFTKAYGNILKSIAYEVFSNEIQILSDSVETLFGGAGNKYVQWILGDVRTNHSADCINLATAPGVGGVAGVYDVAVLLETNTIPGSDALDCHGNCQCHLSPANNLIIEDDSWSDKLVKFVVHSDIHELLTDIDETALRKLFTDRKYAGPDFIVDEILKDKIFHNTKLWNVPVGEPSSTPYYKLNKGFEVKIKIGKQKTWGVTGTTEFVQTPKGIETQVVRIDVEAPAGTNITKLTAKDIPSHVYDEVKQVTGHELGHNFLSEFEQGLAGTALENTNNAKQLLKQIDHSWNQNVDNTIDQIKQVLTKVDDLLSRTDNNLTDLQIKQIKEATNILNKFFTEDDPKQLFQKLYEAYINKDKIFGMNAIDAEKLLIESFKALGVSPNVYSYYQLFSKNEYWAEWFSLFLKDPSKAALLDPKLTVKFAELYPDFVKTTKGKGTAANLPDAVAINHRSDLPKLDNGDVIPPTLSGKDILKQLTNNSAKFTDKEVRETFAKTIKSSPQIARSEFFEDVRFIAIDEVQMKRLSRSSKNVAYYKDNELFINYTVWKDLSDDNRLHTLASSIGQNYYTENRNMQKSVRNIFKQNIKDVLDSLITKFNSAKLKKTTSEEIALDILTKFKNDNNLNITEWMRNYPTLKVILQHVPDLPVRNLEALSSPSVYFREWFSGYITNPAGTKNHYGDKLYSLLQKHLNKDLEVITDLFGPDFEF